jgi:hypothetical protein
MDVSTTGSKSVKLHNELWDIIVERVHPFYRFVLQFVSKYFYHQTRDPDSTPYPIHVYIEHKVSRSFLEWVINIQKKVCVCSNVITPMTMAIIGNDVEILKMLTQLDQWDAYLQGWHYSLFAAENGHLSVLNWLYHDEKHRFIFYVNNTMMKSTNVTDRAFAHGQLEVLKWTEGKDLPSHIETRDVVDAIRKKRTDILSWAIRNKHIELPRLQKITDMESL